MLDVVLVARRHPDHAAPSPVLSAIGRKRHALHVVAARYGDDDVLIGDELLRRELAWRVVHHLSTAVVAVSRSDLVEVLLDERQDPARAREDRLELRYQLDRLAVVVVQLLPLEAGEPAQLHLENGLGLRFGEPESFAELPDEKRLLALVRADELDDLVDVVVRDLQALEDVRALLGLTEIVVGPAPDDLAAVVHRGVVVPGPCAEARRIASTRAAGPGSTFRCSSKR